MGTTFTLPSPFTRPSHHFASGAAATLLPLLLLAAPSPVPAQSPPSPLCTGTAGEPACWMETSNQPGCYRWNFAPRQDETLTWSGGCTDGRASGQGEEVWSFVEDGERKTYSATGELRDGRTMHGRWVLRFSDGEVEEGPYVDGERHGHWVERNEYGSTEKGPYVDGKRQGHWVKRDSDGEVWQEGPYVDGEKHGHWVIRHPNGIVEEGPYVDDKRQGHWVERYSDGEMREEGPYVDGEKHGHWMEWGGSEEGPYMNGERHGHWVRRYSVWQEDQHGELVEKDGREEGPYVNGERRGHWVIRHPNGDVEEGPYVDGEKQGQWAVQRANGDVWEGTYADSERHGNWVVRLANGDVHTGPLEDDIRQGHWVERLANGDVLEGPFKDGEKHGQWVKRNADTTWKSLYVNGKQLSPWVRSQNVTAVPAHQANLTKPGEVFRDCAACPEMVVVPGGTFTMGSPAGEEGRDDDEGPRHEVTVSRFAAGRYEVTFDDWKACRAAGRCSRDPDPWNDDWRRGTRPVVNVSWDNAKQYVAWLSRKTGAAYRLLTEAEWEYAARAGATTAYHWGNAAGSGNANFEGCGSWDGTQPTPAGSFPANRFGLYDMSSNAWEWVEDCWHNDYTNAPEDGSAWGSEGGGDCSRRVLRGGSWNHEAEHARSANRAWLVASDAVFPNAPFFDSPGLRPVLNAPSAVRVLSFSCDPWKYDNIGFRVARPLD